MGRKKAGTKRGREELETRFKGSSHPIAQTNVKGLKWWKGAKYIPIYLTLMDEVVNKTISLDGPRWTSRFWVSFTAEFNKRVKESITKPRSLARFKDFEVEEVMKYGDELWQAYQENKRGREEVETCSICSSNHSIAQSNVKRLKLWGREKYVPIYLTLMDEVVNKTISFDGPMWTYRFLVSFTAEFNKRLKEFTKLRFEDFEIEEVMKYGEELWQAYNENKNKEVVMLKDFDLYEKAFNQFDRISNPPSFSKSGKRPRGSNCFTFTNRSSGSLETTSSLKNGELKEALDRLSHLRRSGKLCLEDLKEAANNFKENAEVPYLWLQLSLEDQVMWIKERL